MKSEERDDLLENVRKHGNGIAGAAMPTKPDAEYIEKRSTKLAKTLTVLKPHLEPAEHQALTEAAEALKTAALRTDITAMGRLKEVNALNIKLDEAVQPLFSFYEPLNDHE